MLGICAAARLAATTAGNPWRPPQGILPGVYYEPDKNDHGLRYNPLKACVVPRPIGWIATVSAAGVVNLAPFSFFNLLSYDPPFVMFSAGVHEEDGGQKDSVANVEATGEFVYSMATWAQRDQMNATARIVERGVDELVAVGLEALPSRLVRPPRVKGSPVHFECRLHHIIRLPGHRPSAAHDMVIGRVVAVHIDDAVLTADGRVDVPGIQPIARLGYKDYVRVDTVFQMDKRTPEDLLTARPPDAERVP
jgi:flavin reductase (DIM6/NTAB) family NADH-FMN oxidoreductase RutF